ncbi:hypothetical protein CBL_00210 [Carabus blaptoides fortunei]
MTPGSRIPTSSVRLSHGYQCPPHRRKSFVPLALACHPVSDINNNSRLDYLNYERVAQATRAEITPVSQVPISLQNRRMHSCIIRFLTCLGTQAYVYTGTDRPYLILISSDIDLERWCECYTDTGAEQMAHINVRQIDRSCAHDAIAPSTCRLCTVSGINIDTISQSTASCDGQQTYYMYTAM